MNKYVGVGSYSAEFVATYIGNYLRFVSKTYFHELAAHPDTVHTGMRRDTNFAISRPICVLRAL